MIEITSRTTRKQHNSLYHGIGSINNGAKFSVEGACQLYSIPRCMYSATWRSTVVRLEPCTELAHITM